MQTSIVFSQRTWTGAGDLDDCWVVSALQCVNVVAPWLHLVTVPTFRQAAGDPDDGKDDGGKIAEIRLGVRTLYPDFEGRMDALRAVAPSVLRAEASKGRPLSVALMLDQLPARLQYGAKGAIAHQSTIVAKGDRLLFANPLAPMGSRWDDVAWSDVLPAIRAYGNGSCYAVAFPTQAELAPFYPGVAGLVAAAHETPSPEALAAARAAGAVAGFGDAKLKAQAAVAGIAP